MYFSTVLVFLLTFKFIQPTNAIMPFDYKHKEETDQFLEKVTKDLNIYQSNVLDSCVNKFLQMKLVDSSNDKLCKTKKISEPPFFIVKEKKSTCSDWCFETNTEYVNFLNRNINIIKSNLFSDTENFTLILDATYSNHGQCVVNEKKKKVQCLCKGNYEIMVSEMFYISFLNIINKSLSWNPTQRPIEDIFKEEFSALAILLKFYPHSALFYLVYLFHKYEKTSKLYRFASSSKLIADNVELLNADGNDTKNGLTEDKSSIAENDTDIQIFMNIYKFIVSGSGDILDISKKYYEQHRQEPIYVCLLPIVQYLLWDSHNFTDVHFYSKHDFST